MCILRQTTLERAAIEGESPVAEKVAHGRDFLSKIGHVKPGLNLGGPPPKAKYSSMTDSKPVLRRKGEKNLC